MDRIVIVATLLSVVVAVDVSRQYISEEFGFYRGELSVI